jgi:signal transduction histidine kinase
MNGRISAARGSTRNRSKVYFPGGAPPHLESLSWEITAVRTVGGGHARHRSDLALRSHPAFNAVVTGLLAGALAFGCGFPYWSKYPLIGMVAAAECALTAAAGVVLRTSTTGRLSGGLIALAGFTWALHWSHTWDVGPLPLIADWAAAAFYVLLSIGVLLYPTGALHNRAERLWALSAVAWIGGGILVQNLLARPDWVGHSADVVWPNVLADRRLFDRAEQIITAGYLVVAAGYAVVLLWRTRRTSRSPQQAIAPVLVAVAAVGIVAAFSPLGAPVNEVQTAMRAGMLRGTAALIIPIALIGAGVYRQWTVTIVADRLVQLARPASVARVRAALRKMLHDPTLDLLLWAPSQGRWVDADGRTTSDQTGSETDDRRWLVPVASIDGKPLAVVDVDPALRLHESLVHAAIVAGTPALENAQLQAVVLAQLEQTRIAQAATLLAEAQARRQMERDLHDGVQAGLSALAMRLAAARATTADDETMDALSSCRELLDVVLGDLRLFVRGINPVVLDADGLGAALRALADRFPGLVEVESDDARYPAHLEQALFFTLNEALANAVRHAGASRIHVRVGLESRDAQPWLTGTVSDNGNGTARWSPAGGLEGLKERLEVLGGTVELRSAPATGTQVHIRVPLTIMHQPGLRPSGWNRR